jgi:hypothetical protein
MASVNEPIQGLVYLCSFICPSSTCQNASLPHEFSIRPFDSTSGGKGSRLRLVVTAQDGGASRLQPNALGRRQIRAATCRVP